MIKGRLTERQCRTDLLRLIYNRGLIFSLNVFVIGKGQVGKSTGVHFIANRLTQLKRGIPLNKATWKEWDYKKYCTTTPKDFVRLWDENQNAVLALEEAGEQLNYLEWWGLMARVFSSTTNTQGLKKNTCFLITPYFDDIVKHVRSKIDFVMILHNRDDALRRVIATPKYVRISWKNFKPQFRPIRNMILQYNSKSLKEARKYTAWLEKYKQDIADKNKEKVGLYNPVKPISEKNMPDWVRETLEAFP